MTKIKAIILAAGKGTRMAPLTNDCPKPLIKANGKSLIEYQIEKLVAAGVEEIVVNLAYLGDQIKRTLGDGSQFNCKIQYSQEPKEGLETGGGILQAIPLLTEPEQHCFIVVNGDVWADLDYSQLPKSIEGLAHLCLVDNPDHNIEGDFNWDKHSHKVGSGEKRLTFSGISVLHKDLFKDLNPGAFKLGPLLKTAMAEGQVSGLHHTGYWIDIGTPERLNVFEQHIRQQTIHHKPSSNE